MMMTIMLVAIISWLWLSLLLLLLLQLLHHNYNQGMSSIMYHTVIMVGMACDVVVVVGAGKT